MLVMAAGLTSRPAQRNGGANRYSLAAQADLVLQLCAACGVKQVVLAGHSDGALVALMAAAAAARCVHLSDSIVFICCDLLIRCSRSSGVARPHSSFGESEGHGLLGVVNRLAVSEASCVPKASPLRVRDVTA